jgi:excisionase family DNA binding protein
MGKQKEAAKGPYIKASEVAERLNVTRATIYVWVKAGKIPGNKFGPRTVRIPRAEYEEWEEQTRVAPSEAPPPKQTAPELAPIAA